MKTHSKQLLWSMRTSVETHIGDTAECPTTVSQDHSSLWLNPLTSLVLQRSRASSGASRRGISADSTSAALRNEPVMLGEKRNNLSASLNNSEVLPQTSPL